MLPTRYFMCGTGTHLAVWYDVRVSFVFLRKSCTKAMSPRPFRSLFYRMSNLGQCSGHLLGIIVSTLVVFAQ